MDSFYGSLFLTGAISAVWVLERVILNVWFVSMSSCFLVRNSCWFILLLPFKPQMPNIISLFFLLFPLSYRSYKIMVQGHKQDYKTVTSDNLLIYVRVSPIPSQMPCGGCRSSNFVLFAQELRTWLTGSVSVFLLILLVPIHNWVIIKSESGTNKWTLDV